MGVLAKIGEKWALWRFRSSLKRGPGASRALDYDGEVLPYEELLEQRLGLQTAARAQLEPFQSTQPQYPQISATRQLAKMGFRQNSVARRCVDLLCESAIMAVPKVESADGSEANSPLAGRIRDVLRFPSGRELGGPRGSIGPILWTDLFWRYIQDLYVSGNAMWQWFEGQGTTEPVEIWRMPPERTYIQPHPELYIEHYVIDFGGKPFKVPRETVLHTRFWDPLDPFFGVPPLFSGKRALAIDNEITDHVKITLQNLGVPPIALEFDIKEMREAGMTLNPFSVPKDLNDIREMRDRFWDFYGGRHRGKPAIAFGYKIKLIGMDMEKLGASNIVTMSESRICTSMGVPIILINRSVRESDPTRTNSRQAREHFMTGTVTSLLARIENITSERFIAAFDPTMSLRIHYDLSGVDVIREQRLKRAREAGQVLTSGLLSRGRCQDLAGQRREGTTEQQNEFAPLAAASSPERMPGDVGEGVP